MFAAGVGIAYATPVWIQVVDRGGPRKSRDQDRKQVSQRPQAWQIDQSNWSQYTGGKPNRGSHTGMSHWVFPSQVQPEALLQPSSPCPCSRSRPRKLHFSLRSEFPQVEV